MLERHDELLAAATGDGDRARRPWCDLLQRNAARIAEELRHRGEPETAGALRSPAGVESLAEELFAHRRDVANVSQAAFAASVARLVLERRQTSVAADGALGTAPSDSPPERDELSTTDADALPPPPVGGGERRKIDRFEIRGVLGQGGFGTVYRAWDPKLEREVALKVPRAELLAADGAQERFLREARAAAALHHPHVCPVHDVCISEFGFYLVMALVDGMPVSELTRKRQPLPPAQAVDLVVDVTRALQAAHDAGIVHRDLKPSNIIIDSHGRAIVMDFGLAVRTTSPDPRLTQSGTLVGTPAYMSPEQLRGEADIGPASDIYSLGLVLYELLTGQRPHSGGTAADLIAARLSSQVRRPSERCAGLDARLDTICLRALAPSPGDRFASMSEFAAALEPLTSRSLAASTRRASQLADTLPLPLARLYRRAGNAKTALERRQLAYYLWEAALKMLASVAVVEYARSNDIDPDLDETLRRLSRPSLGHWWQIVRDLVPRLAERDPGFEAVNEFLLTKRRHDLMGATGLFNVLGEALNKSGNAGRVRMFELFDRLVEYRNKEIGHGVVGARSAEQYDRTARALLTGIGDVLRNLDVLAGRRLLYVADVRQTPSGDWHADTFELAGLEPERLNPLNIEAARTHMLPRTQRIYLHAAELADGAPAALSPECMLHPLIVYDAATDDVLFLNGRAGRRQAEYLSYTSGDTQRQVLPQEQRELLVRVLGRDVDDRDLAAWADHSFVEESAQVMPDAAWRPEPKCIGEFELISVLGEGGMGRVYRAWQPSLGRQVALKRLNQSTDEKARARFTREIRALGRVDHPAVVKVYTSGADADEYFYAMELVEGADLGRVCQHLEQSTRPSEIDQTTWRTAVSSACEQARQAERQITSDRESDDFRVPHERFHHSSTPIRANQPYLESIVDVIRQIAEAVDVLHRAGVVHRDIKPGNIMVTPSGEAVLTDLGLAQLADEQDGKLTRTRQFVGTLRYASPEQVLAVGGIDRRSDIYSLGATLWELLTLQPLFGATDETPSPDLMQWIQQKEPDAVRKFNESVPRDLEAIVLKCLEKDPDKRYQTAAELADELSRWQSGQTVRARKRTAAYLLLKSVRRHRRRIRTAALIAGLVLATAGAYWWTCVRHSHAYYATWTNRYRIPEGVGELTEEQVRHRFLSYRVARRGWWGPVVELAAVNGSGIEIDNIPPIFGDWNDPTHHVARSEVRYDDLGRIARETGYGRQGRLKWEFVYHYDEQGRCLAKFERDGYARFLSNTNATHVSFEFDDSGYVVRMDYSGVDGRPQPNHDGSFGMRLEYDADGLLTRMALLGADGKPMRGPDQVAQTVYEYEDLGSFRFNTVVRYLDEHGNPVRHAEGMFGYIDTPDEFGSPIRRVFVDDTGRTIRSNFGNSGSIASYDERGNQREYALLDIDGESYYETSQGYAGVRSEYDDRGLVTWQMYFDRQGRPTVSTSEGVAGRRAVFDDAGNETIRIFLGTDGGPTRHNDGTAGYLSEYDERGSLIATRCLDLSDDLRLLCEQLAAGEDGLDVDLSDDLIAGSGGVAGFDFTCDRNGNQTGSFNVDSDGRLTPDQRGAFGWIAEYDEHGNMTRQQFVDGDRSPIVVPGGFAGQRWRYNDLGQLVETSYRDVNDRLILNSDGNAGWKSDYDPHGNEIRRTYFGDDPGEEPKFTRFGYAGWTSEFDDNRRETQRVYFGRDRERVASVADGTAGWRSTFDERGNEVLRVFLRTDPDDDRPALHRDGNYGWESVYDDRDRVVQSAFLDRDGSYAVLAHGYGGFTSEYNERGLEVLRRYFGKSAQTPTRHIDGNAGLRSEYDERGNMIRYRYLDETGTPTLTRSEQIAGWDAEFDQWNRETERAFVDAGENPAPHRDGYYRLTFRYDNWGQTIERAFRDADGNLVELANGIAMSRSTYDTRGNQLTLANFDDRGETTEDVQGVHVWEYKYDTLGRLVRQSARDISGDLTVPTGMAAASTEFTYDEYGRVIRQMYLGVDNHPVLQPDGTAGWEATYDEFGNRLTVTALGVDGDPATYRERGYASYRSSFDNQQRERERTYFDVDGNPVEARAVIQSVTPGFQAARAGVQPGDVIISYNGVEGNAVAIRYQQNLLLEQESRPDTVELQLLRNDAPVTVHVEPGLLFVEYDDYAVDVLDEATGH